VVGTLEQGPDLSHFAGGLDGLGEMALALELGDLLLQLGDLGGGLAAELALSGRDTLTRPAVGLGRRGAGQYEIRKDRDPSPHDGASPGRAGFHGEATCLS
jgi:hypothetical protein